LVTERRWGVQPDDASSPSRSATFMDFPNDPAPDHRGPPL
jgi:hypothetical protein